MRTLDEHDHALFEHEKTPAAFARRQAEEHGRWAAFHVAIGGNPKIKNEIWPAAHLAYVEARVAAHFAGILLAEQEERSTMIHGDNVKTYLVKVSDGQRAYCPSCTVSRGVWVGVTEGGDRLTCCGVCQWVIKRERLLDNKVASDQ